MRHGEPVGGRAYRGHSIDDPLSEKGWQQMWDAVGDDAALGSDCHFTVGTVSGFC